MIRAVFDANVLISGLISAKGAPGKLIDAWLEGQFQLCISPSIMDELKRVLKYPRIMKRLEKRQAEALLKKSFSAGRMGGRENHTRSIDSGSVG